MSTGKPLNPPPWEEFEHGPHPAFKPLDKAEAEKLALAAVREAQQFVGPSAQFMTDKQKFLTDAERRRIHHEASYATAKEQGDKSAEKQHRIYLAQALIDLGQFEQAQYVLSFDGVPLDERLFTLASVLPKACTRPDNEPHDCSREKATATQGNREVEIELDRRVALQFVFSPYHNEVVTIYRCTQCGLLNCMADPPERQMNLEVLRREAAVTTAAGKPQVKLDIETLKV